MELGFTRRNRREPRQPAVSAQPGTAYDADVATRILAGIQKTRWATISTEPGVFPTADADKKVLMIKGVENLRWV